MLNRRSLRHRRYDLEMSSCLYLRDAAHADLSLFLISAISFSANVSFFSEMFNTRAVVHHFDLDVVDRDLFVFLSSAC